MWNEYSERMKYRRTSRKEYQKRNLEKVVRSQFDNVNSHEVKIKNLQNKERTQTINIFAKTSAKTTNTLRSHQRFFISLDPLKAGEKIEWKGETWIVITSSNDKDVYYEGFLLKSNTKLKWSYEKIDAKTQETQRLIAEEHVGVYDSGRLEGINDSNQISLPDGQRRIIMPASIESENLVRGKTRFSFDGKTYRLIDIIFVEQEGIKFLVTDEVLSSPDYEQPVEEEPEEDPETTSRELIGPKHLTIGREHEYRVINSTNSNNWYVVEGENLVNTRVEGRRFFVEVKNIPRTAGEKIKVTVVENTGWSRSKESTIRSVLWRD